MRKNQTHAMEYIKRAAEEEGFTPAYNTLGWYFLNDGKNNTLAKHYFMKAREDGNADANFNLGHMHLYGTLGKPMKVRKSYQG